MNDNLTAYYAKRAAEYEAIYAKPERQPDLEAASKILQDIFNGKSVLEIACGTGYWTERIAQSAAYVLATDINESVLNIARSKTYPAGKVTFEAADLYQIQPIQLVDAVFGGFIWSHIPQQDLDGFVEKAAALVRPGGLVVMMDNRFVEGSSTPIVRRDEHGNTYQTRRLASGEVFSVVKNFPTPDDLQTVLAGRSDNLEIMQLTYFWIASWRKN